MYEDNIAFVTDSAEEMKIRLALRTEHVKRNNYLFSFKKGVNLSKEMHLKHIVMGCTTFERVAYLLGSILAKYPPSSKGAGGYQLSRKLHPSILKTC
jgi:hypothetical protein